MHEVICPHCSKAFKIDEAGYADILSPIAPCFEIALCTPDVAAGGDALGPDDCLCG